MAKKRLLALFLGLALLCSFSLFPLASNSSVSASPDKLKWSIVDTPSEEDYVVVSPSEVNAFVLGSDDETLYAVDIPSALVYKSTDGGVTWEDDLTEALVDDGATLPAWDIAAAPDDPELLAVVTDDRQEVYISEDGGESWMDTGVSDAADWDATMLIADIAISPEYDGNRDIAIGTRNPDSATNGDIWVVQRLVFAGWKAQELSLDATSVRFSPDYEYDATVLAIASDADNTYLCTGIRDSDENTTEWEVTDPPNVEISESSDGSPGKDEIVFSHLALPSRYSGGDKESRLLYACYSSNTAADDAYRIEDTDVYRLDVKNGSGVAIASIAYNDGKLLAGEVMAKASSATAWIHLCFDPEDRPPHWEEPAKPPTGGFTSGRANAQVAWSSDGKLAYCGTSTNYVASASGWKDPANWNGRRHDESAFSRSEDDCDTWNQLSLVDTEMDHLCDYALSDDYETLYLASAGTGFDSIWRSTSDPLGEAWQRVWCFASPGGDAILKLNPEEGETQAIFLATRDTNYARYSLDEGQTWRWFWRPCPNITDLAVVNDELIYVLDDNLVNKGTWNRDRGLWEWKRDIDTGLLSGYAIALSGEDFVFVGEDETGEGKIAYSCDGGASFELVEAVPEPGKMQVIPDEDFASNRIIYAASDDSLSGIYRWTIEGSITWEELNPPYTGFHGLAQVAGALYGAYGPGIVRTLVPHMRTVDESDWDSLRVGLPDGATFRPGTLQAVRDEAVDLWAIDDRGYDFLNDRGCLWVYSDTFVLQTPWPTCPAIGEFIPCDPCACQATTFCFCWRRISLAEQYDLWIAMDERFNYVIAKVEEITPDDLCDPAWCTHEASLRFVCGQPYYWKVRSCTSTEGETIHSRWSPPMSFTVKAGTTREHMHIAPILKVPENGSRETARSPAFSWTGFPHASKYEFILAEDADFSQVIVRKEVVESAYIYRGELDWGRTYFWQVKAIEPAPSEPAIGTFIVMLEPPPAQLPVPLPAPSPVPQTPFWAWVMIGILALLAVLIIALCLATRR